MTRSTVSRPTSCSCWSCCTDGRAFALLAFGDQLWLATRRFAKRLIRNDATATTIMAPIIAPMMPSRVPGGLWPQNCDTFAL